MMRITWCEGPYAGLIDDEPGEVVTVVHTIAHFYSNGG